MTRFKLVLLLVMGGLVSACANSNATTRNVPFEGAALPTAGAPAARLIDVRVQNITVTVPRTLTVSEANRYLPAGDIVWRGDPIGDRYDQITTIFDAAMKQGTAELNGAVPVQLDIEVKRFHALTEKARYSTGGVHNINFVLTLRDPATGAVLGAPRTVRADLKAYGGDEALAAEALGQTQKVRITNHLAGVIREELTTAEGFKNPRLGLIQAMNQI